MNEAYLIFDVRLITPRDVNDFVAVANTLPCKIEVSRGTYIVDGCSIMGLYSLNLSENITVTIKAQSDDNISEMTEKFNRWRVNSN